VTSPSVRASVAATPRRKSSTARRTVGSVNRVSGTAAQYKWELDQEEAIRGITWVIGLIEDAVHAGNTPSA